VQFYSSNIQRCYRLRLHVLLFTREGTSSVLVLNNVVRLRLACAPNPEDLAAVLRATPRAPPGRGVTAATVNQANLTTFVCHGAEYPGVQTVI
jgi:hypothetical protein